MANRSNWDGKQIKLRWGSKSLPIGRIHTLRLMAPCVVPPKNGGKTASILYKPPLKTAQQKNTWAMNKKTGCLGMFRVYMGMTNYPVVCGLFLKHVNKDPYWNQPGFFNGTVPLEPVRRRGLAQSQTSRTLTFATDQHSSVTFAPWMNFFGQKSGDQWGIFGEKTPLKRYIVLVRGLGKTMKNHVFWKFHSFFQDWWLFEGRAVSSIKVCYPILVASHVDRWLDIDIAISRRGKVGPKTS